MIELRPYQQQARECILNEWHNGNKKTLLVLPTGCGKTVVFTAVAADRTRAGGRTLIMAHRGELLSQAASKVMDICGTVPAVEKAESTALGDPSPITVGSVQTLCNPVRLSRFPPDYYDTVIVDEAHHVLSPSYRSVLSHFPDADVLGVTATPDRGDRKNLAEFFDSLAYEYSMADAIKEHYLCQISARMIPLNVDLTEVLISQGDYEAGSLGDALEPYLGRIADEMARCCTDRKTVVFLPLIRTAQRFAALLNEAGFRAAEINGESPDRQRILNDFSEGKYNVLCNAMLLTEGWDCPSVDCIVVLRPTKIRSLYQQMVGRGMRLSPGKENLLLLDFLWMTAKHDLCTPATLFSKDEAEKQEMDRRLHGSRGDVDLSELQQDVERDAVKEREGSLAKELDRLKGMPGRTVDPIQFALSIEAEDLLSYVPTFNWEYAPASEKQKQLLVRSGFRVSEDLTKGMASQLISKIINRRTAQLSTPNQIRCLERYGFHHVGTWTFNAANDMIRRLSENFWKIPTSINPELYVPDTHLLN